MKNSYQPENAELKTPDINSVVSLGSPEKTLNGIQAIYHCTLAEASTVMDVLGFAKLNQKNSTLDALIRITLRSIQDGYRMQLCLSQCIEKKPAVRSNKFDFYCNPRESKPRNIALSDGVSGSLEEKGWTEIRSIQNSVNADINILLGDQDFFTMDALDEWADMQSIQKLKDEITALREAIDTKARGFFGPNVTIGRWSEAYTKEEFLTEAQRAAQSKETWLTGKFRRASERPYLRSWGYPSLAKEKGMSEQELMQFIEGDIIRTAAQYRVESRIIQSRNMVQCWAETCGDPIWPMTISNYDKRGIPPSIPLL